MAGVDAGYDPQQYFVLNERAARSLRGVDIAITALHVPDNNTVVFKNTTKLLITQKFDTKWAEEQAYGKMDPIATYSHTARSIKVDFMSLAGSGDTANLTANISKFVQFTYPSYAMKSGLQALQAPPFFKLSILDGKYIPELQGYITNLEIHPGTADGTAAKGGGQDPYMERKFQVIFNFRVLHSEAMGWQGSEFTTANDGHIYASFSPPGIARRTASLLFGSKIAKATAALLGRNPSDKAQPKAAPKPKNPSKLKGPPTPGSATAK